MKTVHDLSKLNWTVSGYTPFFWRSESVAGPAWAGIPEISAVPAGVPGSVQAALRDAGIVPDWNVGMNSRACEWVENRHWIYHAILPDTWLEKKTAVRLRCLGLDYCGCILVNGQDAGSFVGSHIPHTLDITPFLRETDNVVQIVFELPPRWLGHCGYTSQMREWKPRFNYTWDWVPRIVQVGIWDDLLLEMTDGNELVAVRCDTDADVATGTGLLEISGTVAGDLADRARVSLSGAGALIRAEEIPVAQFSDGATWCDLPVELWWPNLEGEQPLYTVRCELLDSHGTVLGEETRRVGFKHVEWAPCDAAPPEADPWICVVNGRPVFLQGANWAPILPNFADLTEADYRKRLEVYRDIGFNMLRVNGVGFLEREWFYDLCDELGLMVWQDFPLSSSGLENWPPEDEESIAAMAEIAASYIARRGHHVSLTLWCGGNELRGDLSGGKVGSDKPIDLSHPLARRLEQVVAENDPRRRFIPTSPTGPRATAEEADFGKGLHWEVHGPYVSGHPLAGLQRYWQGDDALFRAEVAAPGVSPVEIIRAYVGDCAEFPATVDNPYWRRPTAWWIEWSAFVEERGREPRDLEEYVSWSQQRQGQLLAMAYKACKSRFPKCGGILIWEGHDTFPVPANNSIVDFHGNPKPAAQMIRAVLRGK